MSIVLVLNLSLAFFRKRFYEIRIFIVLVIFFLFYVMFRLFIFFDNFYYFLKVIFKIIYKSILYIKLKMRALKSIWGQHQLAVNYLNRKNWHKLEETRLR